MYQVFRDKEEGCTKVMLDPWADGGSYKHAGSTSLPAD